MGAPPLSVQDAPAGSGAAPHKWMTLTVVALGVLIVMVDSTVVNVALPSIRDDLGYLDVTVTQLQWVVNAYALAFAVLLLTAGRLADLFGRRLLFVIGVVLFVGASIGCGAAQDINVMIGFRALQGVGAAIIAPTSLSIISATFPPQERGLAIGIWSGIVGVGVALGPLIGGVLTETVDWRWVFYVNIPIGAAALVGAFIWVRESRDTTTERRIDFAGVIFSAIALFALTFALLRANEYGWRDPRILILLTCGFLGLLAFVLVERVQKSPVLDLSLFRSRTFSGANATAVFVGFALFGVLFFGSLFMQNVMGYSAIEAGASLMPMMVPVMILAPIVGKLTDRIGPRWLLTAGMVLLSLGLVFFSRLDFGSTFWDLLPAMVIGGTGFALVLTPLTAAALAGVPVRQAGMGAAAINSTRQIGGSLGLAVMGAISSAEIKGALHEGQASLEGFVRGFHSLTLVGAAVTIVGAVVACLTVTRSATAAAPAQQGRQSPPTWSVTPTMVVSARPGEPGTLVPVDPVALTARDGDGDAADAPGIEVVTGPSAGTRIAVGYRPFVFGRSESGPAKLGGDSQLSRRHASMSLLDPGRILIEDLDSTNGTFVNEYRVLAPTVVAPGDAVRLGATTLRIVGADAGTGPAPVAVQTVAANESAVRL